MNCTRITGFYYDCLEAAMSNPTFGFYVLRGEKDAYAILQGDFFRKIIVKTDECKKTLTRLNVLKENVDFAVVSVLEGEVRSYPGISHLGTETQPSWQCEEKHGQDAVSLHLDGGNVKLHVSFGPRHASRKGV